MLETNRVDLDLSSLARSQATTIQHVTVPKMSLLQLQITDHVMIPLEIPGHFHEAAVGISLDFRSGGFADSDHLQAFAGPGDHFDDLAVDRVNVLNADFRKSAIGLAVESWLQCAARCGRLVTELDVYRAV